MTHGCSTHSSPYLISPFCVLLFMYLFPRAVIQMTTKWMVCNKRSLLSVQEAGVWNQGDCRIPPAASSSSDPRHFLSICSQLSSCHHFGPFLPSMSLLCIANIRTLAIRYRAHRDNPGWSHPEILNYKWSAKTVFPSNITFTNSRGLEEDRIWRGGIPFNHYTIWHYPICTFVHLPQARI